MLDCAELCGAVGDSQVLTLIILISSRTDAGDSFDMLWTIIIILLVLWLLGLVSGYTLGGILHILLVVAVVVLIVNLVRGRRVV